MLKKLLMLFCFFLTAVVAAHACINGETKMLKDGTLIAIDEKGEIIPYGHTFLDHNYTKKLQELERMWRRTRDVDYLSDYGIVLILQKRYEEAKRAFLEVERLKPGRYSTASNLGTVHELLGDNENALIWIRKAIDIDPSSHKSSEWLHVKILEAKLKGEAFVNSAFLLNTNFGTQVKPQSTLSSEALLKLRDALYYQLNERVSFIKPEDKIVASLLFDLANVCVLTNAKQEAAIIYKQAQEYGYSDPLLETRLNFAEGKQIKQNDTTGKVNKVLVKGEERNSYLMWAIITLCALVIVFAIARRWRKKNLSS